MEGSDLENEAVFEGKGLASRATANASERLQEMLLLWQREQSNYLAADGEAGGAAEEEQRE